jgi:uncharacterized protein (UPF0548 family)
LLTLGPVSAATLERQLSISSLDQPSYPEVGATQGSELPSGYRHDHYLRRIGGLESFDRAVWGLRHWAAHEGAGVHIYPNNQPLTQHSTVLAVLKFGPVRILAPCRIIRVVDSADAFGFSYGTLPGHPEQGEESFVVERHDCGVIFTIVAFSKPVEIFDRLGGPIARLVQRSTTDRYVEALKSYTLQGGEGSHK